MNTEELKEIIRQHVERTWHQGEMSTAAGHCAEEFIYHDPASSALTGLNAYLDYIATVRKAFPDLRYTIHDMVGEEGKIVVRWEFTGTHLASIRGITATGKQVKFSGMTFYTEKNNLLAEAWTNWDTFGYMQQLGALPVNHRERGGWTMEGRG